MKVKWWGHSSFFLEIDGIKIITDPYDNSLPYKKITDKADYVTVSHGHFDHNAVDRLKGEFKLIDDINGFKNEEIKIEAIKSYHDSHQGSDRGENLIYLITAAGKKICHLGDLGHLLDDKVINKLKNVDLLLIPVGGNYTINAEQAYKLSRKIKAKTIIPMHYKTDILDFPIKGVKEFTDRFNQNEIKIIGDSEVEINEEDLNKVLVLDYVK